MDPDARISNLKTRLVVAKAWTDALAKDNPNHDPETGQFSSGEGGSEGSKVKGEDLFSINPQHGLTDINTSSLPRLEGSEKQVKWAEDIRRNRARYLANQFDQTVSAARAKGIEVSQQQRADMLSKYGIKHAAELHETSARKWIDRR